MFARGKNLPELPFGTAFDVGDTFPSKINVNLCLCRKVMPTTALCCRLNTIDLESPWQLL